MTREQSIIELGSWLKTPPGQYLLAWEQDRWTRRWPMPSASTRCSSACPNSTPARQPHAAPLGGQRRAGARAAAVRRTGDDDITRRPRRWRCTASSTRCRSRTPASTCVVLPHTLELARDPHQTLREVERVLVPEGRVVITGFNPASLWGLRQRAGHLRRRAWGGRIRCTCRARANSSATGGCATGCGCWASRSRAGRFGCWRPPLKSQRWLDRFGTGWTASATAGGRCWAPCTSLVAVKRVRGMRLVGLARPPAQARARRRPVVTQRCRRRPRGERPRATRAR
jgi:hypothetical protein